MKLFKVFTAIVLGLSLAPTCFAHDSHGHIIHRDRDGHCSVDEDSEDEDYESDSDDECIAWAHGQKEIEPGFEDEDDPTYEVDHDASWPSKKENFSEMFR